MRILVVDDQEAVLLTYVLVLQLQGYEVTGAATYAVALENLHNTKYDLLLCDFGLDSGRNGLDVIDAARAQQPQIAPILLTGYASPEIMEETERRGVAVLYKPVEVKELLQALQAVAGAWEAA